MSSGTLVFPSNFSLIEQCQTLAILAEVDNAVRAYEGNFTAPWLLSPIHESVWLISKGAETRYVDGKLVNYYEYQWATKLYDGSNLIDPKNRTLLNGMQKLAFLARELPGGPTTLTTFKGFLWSLNLLVRWAFVNGDILDPREHGLTKMTFQHFSDFFVDLSKGGSVFALHYPERFLQAVFPLAFGRAPTAQELGDPLSLSSEVCVHLANWLWAQGYIKRVNRSNEMTISSSSISELIGVDVESVRGGSKWKMFVGQFGIIDGKIGNPAHLMSSPARRELPSQRALTTDEARDVGVSEKTLNKYFDDLKNIVALHRHLPDFCPDPMGFQPKELRNLIVSMSDVSNHTPWIPLTVAMSYTTEALRWVHVYGDDLVTTFLQAYQDLNELGLLVSAPMPDKENPTNGEILKAHREAVAGREKYVAALDFPPSLAPLKIVGWGSCVHIDGKKAFEKLRGAPSLLDAIMVLVGAITVVVTMVKPMRESEFRALQRECLLHVPGDGYWLSHELRKKNVGDARPEDARPIPVIAAKAIQLLRKLTDGLKEIVGVTDTWVLNSLLTLPIFGRYEANVQTLSSQQLNMLLDTFCDFVALPADGKGRRWYLRIHEMRKSFLITFFWSYRFGGLDAARWIAGHNDATHVYTYIQANFPGEELPNLEAQYASQVLREYQESGTPNGPRDVEALYRAVCQHFSVRDVSWIDESTLREWLELQFETREFEIIPYSLRNPDGGVITEIAFRISADNALLR